MAGDVDAPGVAAETLGILVDPRYGRAGLADDLVYRHPGTEIVVHYHARDTPGYGTPRQNPNSWLVRRHQKPPCT